MPVPLDPEVMLIHEALLEADHEHPAPAVTDTLPVPAEEPKELLVGEMENEHDPPDWFTVKVFPAMVRVPVLEDAAVLAATE